MSEELNDFSAQEQTIPQTDTMPQEPAQPDTNSTAGSENNLYEDKPADVEESAKNPNPEANTDSGTSPGCEVPLSGNAPNAAFYYAQPVTVPGYTASEAPESPSQPSKKSKKRICIVLVIVLVLAIAGSLSFFGIRRATSYAKIEQAVEDYKSKTITYESAEQILTDLMYSKDDHVSERAKSGIRTITDLQASRKHMKQAQKAYKEQKYEKAYRLFSTVLQSDPDYEQAHKQAAESLTQWRKSVIKQVGELVTKHEVSKAFDLVNKYMKDRDKQDAEMEELKSFLEAEDAYQRGDLPFAQKKFKALPSTLTVGNVQVRDRLKTMIKYDYVVNLCGIWSANDNYYETKATRYGRWRNWYNNYYTGATKLYMNCMIQDDGTINYEVSVWYYTYKNFSTYKSNLQAGIESVKYEGNFSLPNDERLSLTLSDTGSLKSTLTFDGKEFNFKQHNIQWNSGTRYDWWVDATYGGRTDFIHLDPDDLS